MQKNALRAAAVGNEDVPMPQCTDGSVLIANRHSLISAGTEMTAVGSTKKDMVKKALGDPDIRQSVVDMLVQDGVSKTSDRVQYEMTKWTPLGYSGAGIAIEVGANIDGIRVGDRVAYAGQGHAEIIRAAKNLCVPVPDNVTTQEAAFVALGSIAMQAVRRADVQVGDVVAVLGLGLVGQLVSQLLQAAGARVIGTDVMDERLELAQKLGAEICFDARGDVVKNFNSYTDGLGVDCVMICASSGNRAVIEQAVKIARERGRVVAVGQCSLDVPRNEFYMKELDLVISRSYGPGRYDPSYEEHGVDYPIGFVRWTERRNMAEFLRLIASKKVDVKALITHEFALDDAQQGYELLMDRPSECLAVLLRYPDEEPDLRAGSIEIAQPDRVKVVDRTVPNIAVIGCGSFAKQFHLPNLKRSSKANLHTLAASSGQSAKEMGQRFGAQYATTDLDELFANPDIDAVMIFTRDKQHAELSARALRAGKHVFCEKPLATDDDDIEMLREAGAGSDRLCMTGFNRRFAPMLVQAKEVLDRCHGPKIIHFRVNAGGLPKSSWVFDPNHSAGRIVGEACHFVDLFRWLIGAEAVSVSAHSLGSPTAANLLDDVTATLDFADGSLATLIYTAQGSPSIGKERLEAFCDGTAITMDDYRTLSVRGASRIDLKHRAPNKGHDVELEHFFDAISGTATPQITLRDGLQSARLCLAILESARHSAREVNTGQ